MDIDDWGKCIHWRVCQNRCPSPIHTCRHFVPFKRGEWRHSKGGTWIFCSNCENAVKEETRYCPNCGAEMED